MIAVIFEVQPGDKAGYLAHAAQLREHLEHVDGFLGVERFQSLTDPDKLLSLSFFEDEDAVARWRSLSEHRAAQAWARDGNFHGYRLRVAHVLRDYGMDQNRDQAPVDSQSYHKDLTGDLNAPDA